MCQACANVCSVGRAERIDTCERASVCVCGACDVGDDWLRRILRHVRLIFGMNFSCDFFGRVNIFLLVNI
jgi:hypothetical protein